MCWGCGDWGGPATTGAPCRCCQNRRIEPGGLWGEKNRPRKGEPATPPGCARPLDQWQRHGKRADAGGWQSCLVAVVVGLEWALGRDADVLGLLGAELGERNPELGKVSVGDLLVELLRQHVHAERVRGGVVPESELGEHLVGERARHDERRVA